MRRQQRGKVVTLVALVGALAVAALALRRPVEDAWSLHVLETGSPEARARAVARLAEHECWRAVPVLLRLAAYPVEVELAGPLEKALSRLARPPALRHVPEALSDPDYLVLDTAVAWLASVEPFDRETMRLLGRVARGQKARLGEPAARALLELGPLAREAVPPLRECLNAAGDLQHAAAQCDPDAVSTLLEWIASPSGRSRALAMQLLPLTRLERQVVVRHLIGALDDEESDVREAAILGLAAMAPDCEETLRPLARFLDSEEISMLSDNKVFEALDRAGARSIPVLKEALAANPENAVVKTRLLADLWRREKVLAPEILESLAGRGSLLPDDAAFLLADLGPAAKAAVPALERVLAEGDLDLRADAAVALAMIEPQERPRLEWLAPILEENGIRRRSSVARAAPGLPGLVEEFLDVIVRANFDLRMPLWNALAHAGPVAAQAVANEPGLSGVEKADFLRLYAFCRPREPPDVNISRLLDALAREDEDTWRSSLDGFQYQRPLQGDLIDICIRALGSSRRDIVLSAMEVLDRDDAPLERALPPMLEHLRSRSPRVAVQSARVLSRHTAAVPGLAAALRDHLEQARCLAAFALGRMGKDAMPALPALEAVAEGDASDLVRATAADSLRALRASRASLRADARPESSPR